jgi:hypothetical protein
MGNSTEHFIGAETPGVSANVDTTTGKFLSFRDATGKVLRQGARFRVYEYDQDANGSLSNPRELSIGGDVVDIEWRVHLANRKASFFVFDGQNGAADLYATRSSLAPATKIKTGPDRTNLRNATVPAAGRADLLEIDPGEKLISPKQPAPVELSNPNSKVPIESLGTLLLDGSRLIVLGGYGESNSTTNPPAPIDEYASNDNWFDDAGDGPVKARIRFSDESFIDADPAWVMVGPPDFAPGIGNVVSLYDTLWDTAVREAAAPPSTPTTPMMLRLLQQKKIWATTNPPSLSGFKPSFTQDIYPILKRALGARDVHQSNSSKPNYHKRSMGAEVIKALSDPNDSHGNELRTTIFNYMRDPDSTQTQWDKMPRGLGDEAYPALDGDPAQIPPRAFLSLTRIQYAMLREWKSNNFIADWPGTEPQAQLKPAPSPDDLDQAATENCVGGPFFPGIEVSWLIRVKDLYSEPFRLRIPLTPESESPVAPLKIGALEFRAGFFSQQMALPWQADFYDCHKESHQGTDGNEYYFMWWTAQRPDDVFPSGKPAQERWVRSFDAQAADPDDIDTIEGDNVRFNQMQQHWSELKFVSVLNGDHYEEEP